MDRGPGFISRGVIKADRAIIIAGASMSLVFCSLTIALYYFLYWWNKRFVDQTVTRMTIAALASALSFSSFIIATEADKKKSNAECTALGFFFRGFLLMFHWICFFAMFQMQIIVVHRVKNYARLEKWYYLMATCLSFVPTLYPTIRTEHGFRLQFGRFCGFRRYGDPKSFAVWWGSFFAWSLLAIVLTVCSMILVILRVRKSLIRVREKSLKRSYLARNFPITILEATTGNRVVGESEYHETISRAALKSLHMELSARALKKLIRRLIWIPMIPILTHIIYVVSTILDYAAGRSIPSTLILGHFLISLHGFFMSLSILTEDRIWLCIKIAKGEFVAKWYDEQYEYWLVKLRREDSQYRPESKPRDKSLHNSTLDLPSYINIRQLDLDETDHERRPEFEGLRAKVAFWMCKKLLL